MVEPQPHIPVQGAHVYPKSGILTDGGIVGFSRINDINLAGFKIGQLDRWVRDDRDDPAVEIGHIRMTHGLAIPPVGIPSYLDPVAGTSIV